jgi:hypothetical protein
MELFGPAGPSQGLLRTKTSTHFSFAPDGKHGHSLRMPEKMIVCVAVVGHQVHPHSISPLWSPYLLVLLVHPIINLMIDVVFDRTTRFTYRASPRPTTPSSSTTSSTALSTSSTSEVIEYSDLVHDPYGSASRFSRKIVENLKKSEPFDWKEWFLDFKNVNWFNLNNLCFTVNNPKKSGSPLNETFLGLLYPTENYKVWVSLWVVDSFWCTFKT